MPEHTVLAQPKKQTQNLSVYIKEVKPSVHTLPQKYKIHVGRSQVPHLDCGAALPVCPALDRVNPKTRCDGARMPLRGEEEAGTHQLLSPGNKCDPDAVSASSHRELATDGEDILHNSTTGHNSAAVQHYGLHQ